MAVKAKAGISGSRREIKHSGPKMTRQGNGTRSKPRGTRKLRNGQGR